ncbi:MAG: type I glyceraldehyde-3-phosphate dehydrogenase [Roseobacter sp.]
MTLKLAINGFGRIGRNILRALCEDGRDDIEIIAINDPAPTETLAHLFEFDSFHGRFSGSVETDGDSLIVNGKHIAVSHLDHPSQLRWSEVDIALECSGHFTALDAAREHLKNGSTRVLLSAPAKGDMPTLVYGVNNEVIAGDHLLVSNGSCTTNCLVPVAHVLHEAFEIQHGMMTTVHSYTGNQPTHDAPHADLYRARAAALSMIPTSTGAAETLGLVLPDLAGKITGHAIRVPCPNVSCVDLCVEVRDTVTADQVNQAFEKAAQTTLKGVVSTTSRKLVSMDFAHHPDSAVVATDQTRVQSGKMVRVLAWYDNEWGFSNRMLDAARLMGRQLSA